MSNTCTSCHEDKHRVLEAGRCVCPVDYRESNQSCIKPDLSPVSGPVGVVKGLAATGAAAATPTILLLSPAIIVQLLEVLQLVSFIQYIQVNYPPVVYEFINSFNIFDFNFFPKLVGEGSYEMRAPRGFQS